MTPGKRYLGDGVYAEWDSFGGLVLTMSDRVIATNTVVLEIDVLRQLRLMIKEGFEAEEFDYEAARRRGEQ